ncbi:TPA: Hok/Gef family protein [Photobacterium damselae]
MGLIVICITILGFTFMIRDSLLVILLINNIS